MADEPGGGVSPEGVAAEEAVTLSALRARCETHERVLRNQYPEGKLPARMEADLAGTSTETAWGAVERLAVLRHFYRVRAGGGLREAEAPCEKREAVRQLLTREPLRFNLENGREVAVTSRSWAARYWIAAHYSRVQELGGKLREAEEAGDHRGMRRVLVEMVHQRRAMYAHAFTPSGASAKSLEEAPEWWEEITPADDPVLTAALLGVAEGRTETLGPPPEIPGGDGSVRLEDFGLHMLFASVAQEEGIPVAEVYDRDLHQMFALRRAGASPIPRSLLERNAE